MKIYPDLNKLCWILKRVQFHESIVVAPSRLKFRTFIFLFLAHIIIYCMLMWYFKILFCLICHTNSVSGTSIFWWIQKEYISIIFTSFCPSHWKFHWTNIRCALSPFERHRNIKQPLHVLYLVTHTVADIFLPAPSGRVITVTAVRVPASGISQTHFIYTKLAITRICFSVTPPV